MDKNELVARCAEMGRELSDEQIARGMVGVLSCPLTIKMRTGWSDGSLLAQEPGRAIKARFRVFNDAFDALRRAQARWAVPDPALRAELRAEIGAAVLPAWGRFYAEYSEVRFSKQSAKEYLRWSPDAVRRVIDAELFAG